MLLGCITGNMPADTFEGYLAFGREIGLDAIAFNPRMNSAYDARRLTQRDVSSMKRLLAAYGLQVCSVAHMGLNVLHPDERERAAAVEYHRHLIDLSAALGAGMVGSFTGRMPDLSVEANLPLFEDVWSDLAEYAAERNVRIVFENCPLFEGFPFRSINMAYSPEYWDLLLSRLPANVGLELDLGHLPWLQIDPLQVIADYAERIFHVHLKDCRIDRDALHAKTIYGEGWFSYCAPGEGELPWAGILAALHRNGYQGALTLDVRGDDIEGKIRRGVRYVRELLTALGLQGRRTAG